MFFELLRKRKIRREAKKAAQLEADNHIARDLAQDDWIQHNCKEIEILNRRCFYSELPDQTIFIKVKNGKLRIGHLNNFFTRSKKLDEAVARLDTLELEKTGTYEAFGAETGFMFIEIEPDAEIDFDKSWRAFQSILENTKKRRKALEFISIQAYQELLDQKKLLDRY